MMKHLRNITRYAALLCVGGLLGVLLIEGALYGVSRSALGYVLPLQDPQFGAPDKDIGYAYIPGARGMWTKENRAQIRINTIGLRDKEVLERAADNVFRVALLGDSVVEALQVPHDYTFENLAESALQNRGQNIEIANLAMSGAGPMRQLLRLEHSGVPLKPDMALFMVDIGDFLGRELVNDSEFPAYRENEQGEMVRSYDYLNRFSQRHIDTIYGKAFIGGLRYSQLFRALNERRKGTVAEILGLRLPDMSLPFIGTEIATQADKKSCVPAPLERAYHLWADHEPRLHWQATQQFLKDTQEVATAHKIAIAAALYIQLPNEDCPAEIKRRQELVLVVDQAFKAHSLSFIDWNAALVEAMTMPLREHIDVHNLRGFGLNLGNGHLNYRGHRVFAQTLETILQPSVKTAILGSGF